MSIFFDLKSNPSQFLIENEFFFSILDGYPVNPGHCLIIPRREIKSILDLNTNEWANLRLMINNVIKSIKSTDLLIRYKTLLSQSEDEIAKKFLTDAITHLTDHGFKPAAYNHGINDGIAAGRSVHHLHWHIIPRFDGDIDNPVGGVRGVIPAKRNCRS